RVQVDCSDHHLAPCQTAQSSFAPLRQCRQATATLAERPFQQRIVTAPDNRRGGYAREPFIYDQSRQQTAVECRAWEQPASGHLRARHCAPSHELIELAL